MRRYALVGLLSLSLSAAHAEKVHVKIIQRQVNDNGYSNFVPGHAYSTASGSSAYTTYTAPHAVSYSVTGATFTLLLLDGRMAVVNCVSKYSPKGDYINRRSCRMPLVDDVDVEFKGEDAKLYWVVSIDGKKTESETYTILAILPPQIPAETQKPQP